MAHLTGPLFFTGSVGGLRSYYNRSLKRYILSTKGGCSREIILNSPKFARTRENMSEFNGCSQWASLLRRLLNPLSHLRKGYYFSAMMSMAKLIQKGDTVSPTGHRSIGSSRAGAMLPGLQFNAGIPFERLIFLNYELSRTQEGKQLQLTIPSFRSALALHWPTRIVSWRLTLLTALLPDVKWSEKESGYLPALEGCEQLTRIASTEWRGVSVEEVQIVLSTEVPPVVPETLLVVALGVEINTAPAPGTENYGTMRILAVEKWADSSGQPQLVKGS